MPAADSDRGFAAPPLSAGNDFFIPARQKLRLLAPVATMSNQDCRGMKIVEPIQPIQVN